MRAGEAPVKGRVPRRPAADRSFRAVGKGGQFVQVVPDLDVVAVVTSDAKQSRTDAGELVGQAIIPAATD